MSFRSLLAAALVITRSYSLLQHVGAGQSNFIQRLADPWTTTGPRVRLGSPTYAWERQTGAVNEAPEPLYRNGRVLVVY